MTCVRLTVHHRALGKGAEVSRRTPKGASVSMHLSLTALTCCQLAWRPCKRPSRCSAQPMPHQGHLCPSPCAAGHPQPRRCSGPS